MANEGDARLFERVLERGGDRGNRFVFGRFKAGDRAQADAALCDQIGLRETEQRPRRLRLSGGDCHGPFEVTVVHDALSSQQKPPGFFESSGGSNGAVLLLRVGILQNPFKEVPILRAFLGVHTGVLALRKGSVLGRGGISITTRHVGSAHSIEVFALVKVKSPKVLSRGLLHKKETTTLYYST
jgi:hypothetical protein